MRILGRVTPSVGLCALVAFATLPAPLAAQLKDQGNTIERFLNAVADRRQSVSAAKFELSGRTIYAAQSLRNHRTADQYYPIHEMIGEFRELNVLDFERNRFRQDYHGFEMFVNEKGVGEASTIRRIHTFDGKDMYTLHPRNKQNEWIYHDAPQNVPEGDQWDLEKAHKKMPASVFFFASYPMLFACGRIPDPNTNFRIDARPKYHPADFQYRGIVLTSGVRCVVLRWVRPPVTSNYCEWYVDSQDLARIVRCARVSNGQVAYDLEIHYVRDSRSPSHWIVREYDNDNPRRPNKLVKQRQFNVVASEFNQAMTDSQFSPDFTPGMLVTTKDGVFPVASDGKTLLRPSAIWGFRKYALSVLLVSAAVVVVLIGATVLRKWRRAQGVLRSPN